MDFERHQNLPGIIVLRDVIRKWWSAELRFADRDGVVWAPPGVRPPSNGVCRVSLSCREGVRRCTNSIRVLHAQFTTTRAPRRAFAHDCHLGFHIVGAPLLVEGEYAGFVFVEGFARSELDAAAQAQLRARLREIAPGSADVERAVERVPRLDLTDTERVADLLELAAQDLSAAEEALAAAAPPPPAAPAAEGGFAGLVGASGAMREVFRLVERVAQADSTVLVTGESGTGKELVAHAIHRLGPRAGRPFVAQNCSAFNDNLLESALFGHVRGAFTGAQRDQKGLFEAADGGTLFLDEVGDMSPALQVKLLRVLQEGTFLPVGGTTPRRVDVRVLAATHKDLGQLVQQGLFREDLYYRIHVIRVVVPPLRERLEDLPALVEHFLTKHRRPGQLARGLAPETLALLLRHHWPGNIRELENELERMLVLGSEHPLLPPELVSPRLRDALGRQPGALTPLPFPGGGGAGRLDAAVEHLEREMISQGLVRTGGNKSRLARELGISRSNLLVKISRYGLDAGPSGVEDETGT
jgi:transcriptional regulator with GAF, ATPase, and Fis domain